MKRSPIVSRASSRISRYGEMAAVITGTPLRESRSATNAIRRMLVSRSSFEKPSPLERFSRTTSPSSTSILEPRSRSCSSTIVEMVVLPAPESPVNQSVKPLSSAIAFLFVGVDQDLSHLRAAELLRRKLTVAEHLPDLRAAQEDVVLLAVRTGLARPHALALVAPERVLEEERLDAELVDVDFVEDLLRVVGAVVVTDAGVVAPDDEVGAPVVPTCDRVEDGLARPGVVHLRREDAEDHPVVGVVVLHQDLVAAHPHVGRDVARLGLPDQRVDEEAIGDLEGALRQVLVRSVDRVPGLEGDDALPAALLECLAGLLRREVALHERFLVVGQRVDLVGAGDAARALLEDCGDAGVLLVGRAIDVLCLRLEIALEDLGDVQAAERLVLVAGDLDGVSLGDAEVGGEGDRDRPVGAVGKGHVLDDALPLLVALRAPERGEASVADHLEVGGLAVGQLQLGGGLGHGLRMGRKWIVVVKKRGRVTASASNGLRPAAPPRTYPWRPHSVFEEPAQRPARASSPCPGFLVQWVQPIEG